MYLASIQTATHQEQSVDHIMPRNKPRLELALYARPKHPGTYHYALFTAPKTMEGPLAKHHSKNTLQIDASGEATAPWRYEQTTIDKIESESRLLVRVIIAKVLKPGDRAALVLDNIPVHQINGVDNADSEIFTCRTWARDELLELRKQGVVSTELGGWEDVERMALQYVDRKREQRRWDSAWTGSTEVPTMDLLEGKEVCE